MKKSILFSSILLVFLNSCLELPDDITIPTWDVELNAPIIDTLYYLDDIIKVDKNIKIDSSSGKDVYYIESDTYKRYFSVSEFVKNQLDGNFHQDIPVMTGDSLINVPISSGAEIDSAHIKSGFLLINLTNNSSESVQFKVRLPRFKDAQGNVFGFNGNIAPNSNFSNNYNLSDFRYSARDQVDKSNLEVYVDSKPSNPSAEQINIDISLSQSDFYYVEGKLPSKKVKDVSELFSLPMTDDIKKLRDNLEFTNAEMIISAKYLSSFDEVFSVEFQDFSITGLNNEGGTKKLTDGAGNSNLGNILIDKGVFERTYNNSNSNISDFLSYMPDNVSIVSGVFMNPTDTKGIATDKDSIEVSVKIRSSSEIKIKEVTMVDTLEFEVDEDIRKEIKNGKLIQLVYNIENAIPVEHEMVMSFTDASYQTMFTKNISLSGAKVIDNNKNISPKIIKDRIILDSNEVQKLADTHYMILSWKAYTDQEPYTAFFSKDQYFKIKTYCSAIYNVRIEDEDDND